jgi:hypothetical protein
VSNPTDRPGPCPVFPPEYPYGTPADPALCYEPPGPAGSPPPWTAPPPPGFVPVSAETVAARAQAAAALIVALLLLVPCFDVIVVPAIVTSAIALSRGRTDVPLARVLIRFSWIWIVVSVVLAVAFVGWAVATGPSTPAR